MERITLFENALDYVLDAVNRLNSDEPDIIELKYSIVHLWNGRFGRKRLSALKQKNQEKGSRRQCFEFN